MKDMGIVTGSKEQAQPLIVGVDTVYVHTEIKPVEKDTEGKDVEGLFQYHEVQYDKDEYTQIMSENITNLCDYSTELLYMVCLLELGIDESDVQGGEENGL